MKEKLNELRNNCLIEISNWWGLGCPGYKGKIITNDKKIYSYIFYNNLPNELEENNIPKESIIEEKTITDKEYQKIIKFIEKEIEGKTFIPKRIFDVGYDVTVNYKNKNYKIINDKDYENEDGIYDKLEKLLKEGEYKYEK